VKAVFSAALAGGDGPLSWPGLEGRVHHFAIPEKRPYPVFDDDVRERGTAPFPEAPLDDFGPVADDDV
jgi:hypothetical protein